MIRDARGFYEQGWLLGTSGNLSIKLDDDHFLITASGRDKGRLTPEDFLACPVDGEPSETTPTLGPSAETSIHQAIYARVPEAGAVYHVHEPYSAFCSERDSYIGATIMAGAEMIKGLGIWEENPRVRIPIFENHFDVPQIAADIDRHLADEAKRRVPGVNIRSHGYYAWGEDAFAAKRHVETFAYLFRYSWEMGNGA
ncbi:methylthioribulose 1-phosphate dehydratase [Persicimonas caeni]|uniref:Methylthioribulose-1-phosphate dehydratase n=2 Tax=Persicimonas caeni TaxID=2292766 RepID=A0A4Y6Q2L9_PERCE|nr:methylthioribulose 1-phosphate dehydratase [Persicimonas caeni]QED36053.1 methylthioribulose 1-phosphate dehydratase [Persicimonas caeni]